MVGVIALGCQERFVSQGWIPNVLLLLRRIVCYFFFRYSSQGGRGPVPTVLAHHIKGDTSVRTPPPAAGAGLSRDPKR